jgi:4-amino-4-deoxy-L-arabinose transferase-like glycosyltransferase
MPLKAWGPGVAACFLFIALGAVFIPLAGLQTDEALFSSPLYLNPDNNLLGRIARGQVPLMVMTYLGSLKALVWAPILAMFGPGVWAVRFPAVLIGAATIFFFYHLVRSSQSPAAAGIGAFLLATDPVFLLTNTFDWGPVAIDHFLLVTGCWLLYRFGSRKGPVAGFALLFGGFFCFGLALWNKALFVWSLAGLSAAGLTVFWREVRRALSARNATVAAGAFLLGASPLIVFNLRHGFPTVSENARIDMQSLAAKWIQVRSAANGHSLMGYLVAEEDAGNPRPIEGLRGRVAESIHGIAGTRRSTGFYYALGAMLAAVPLWWRSRAARFALVYCGVAWLSMALTRDAGGSAHHVILMWPFPILFAAAALSSIPWRLGAAAAAALVGMNLLVLNQHLYQLERMGSWDSFSTAIFPLSESLKEDGRIVYLADWGMFDSLQLLHEGRLKLRVAPVPADPQALTEVERKDLEFMLADREALVVGHLPEREFQRGSGAALERLARERGFRKELLRTVADRNGRPVFEVYRFRPEGL